MQSIRSLLWIGPAETLARSGAAQSPTLDITWVPDVPAALALPPMTLDAVILSGPGEEDLLAGMSEFRRRPGRPPILAWLGGESPPALEGTGHEAECIRRLLAAGARDVLLAPPGQEDVTLRGELLARLDAWEKEALQAGDGHAPGPRDPDQPSPVVGQSAAMRS